MCNLINWLVFRRHRRDDRSTAASGRQAAALSLAMLRQLLATCDQNKRGRRDRALLLFGFADALRRSELTFLRVEDVAVVSGGLRLRIRRGKTDQAGQGAEIGLPRGKFPETCPVRAFEAWQAVAKLKAGPLFRRISTGDRIGASALHPDAIRRILAYRLDFAAIEEEVFVRAVAQPAGRRNLTIDGCRILARQFPEKIEARQVRAAALLRRSHACHIGYSAAHPEARSWLAAHWGITDRLRQVVARPQPGIGRTQPVRLPVRRHQPILVLDEFALLVKGGMENVPNMLAEGSWITRRRISADRRGFVGISRVGAVRQETQHRGDHG